MSKIQQVKRKQPIPKEPLQGLHDFVQEMSKGDIQSFCITGNTRYGELYSVFYYPDGGRAPLVGALEFAKNNVLNHDA